ncbi:ABC transporter ATP-binding protein [Alkaliphilus crotonatoxidans]
MNRLETIGLDGGYENQKIINNISLQVASGEIVGLIGPNGAGKTTLMKTLLGLLPAMGGSIKLNGVLSDERQNNCRESLGYIPEIPYLYDELTLKEHLQYTAMCCGLSEGDYKQRVKELLILFQMEEKLNHFPHSFSKGMRQKVMVMCALLQNPSLLIVDEPFIGLDPRAINQFIKLLYRYKNQGMGILLSTHVLDSAERLCDRFILLNHGKVIFSGTLEQMQSKSQNKEANLMELFDIFVEAQS